MFYKSWHLLLDIYDRPNLIPVASNDSNIHFLSSSPRNTHNWRFPTQSASLPFTRQYCFRVHWLKHRLQCVGIQTDRQFIYRTYLGKYTSWVHMKASPMLMSMRTILKLTLCDHAWYSGKIYGKDIGNMYVPCRHNTLWSVERNAIYLVTQYFEKQHNSTNMVVVCLQKTV